MVSAVFLYFAKSVFSKALALKPMHSLNELNIGKTSRPAKTSKTRLFFLAQIPAEINSSSEKPFLCKYSTMSVQSFEKPILKSSSS